jgi:hypothetical protein
MLEPERPVQITVSTFPTGNLFKAGHRIRLDVSSSNFPRFDINWNTGEPEARATRKAIARNTVYFDRDMPSHVVLPIIPPR